MILETFIEIFALVGACVFIRYLINIYRDIRDGVTRAAKEDK